MDLMDPFGWFDRGDPQIQDLRTPEAKTATTGLLDIAKQSVPDYPVAPVANLTDKQLQAGQMAENYANSGVEGADYLRSVLSNSDNILDDPTYKALLDKVMEQGQMETNRVGRSLQLRGGTSSSTGANILGRSIEDMQSNALAALAPYASANKSLKTGAAQTLASLTEAATLNRLNALSQQGLLEQQMDQLRQQAQYELQMKRLDYPTTVQSQLYAQVAGLPVDWSVTQDPSMFEQLVPAIQTGAMLAMV